VIDDDQRRTVLRAIREACDVDHAEGEAEGCFLSNYLPLSEHARVLEPGVHLIVGDRGAGKSELFRAAAIAEARRAIVSLTAPGRVPPLNAVSFVVGYSAEGTWYPAVMQLQGAASGRSPRYLHALWLGLLVRCLAGQELLTRAHSGVDLGFWQSREAASPANVTVEVERNLDTIIAEIDTVDEGLARQDRWLCVSYDDLDRIGAGDWQALGVIVQGLVQFWSTHVRRWRRIVPKIFLRRDLYDRHALVGADVSKLAARRAELHWTTRDLYAMLLKRIVNGSTDLRAYLAGRLPAGVDDRHLGWWPTSNVESDYEPAVERLCGLYMGAGPTKGKAFTWIPSHLEDGHGRVVPRSIVRLFGKAADIELRSARPRDGRLLQHTSLRNALDAVSESRIEELVEEFPWIRRVAAHLSTQTPKLQVPIDLFRFRNVLSAIRWEDTGAEDRAPETTGAGMLGLLEELGVVFRRHDGRADVRDLYMRGFGLKRKGGVSRRPAR